MGEEEWGGGREGDQRGWGSHFFMKARSANGFLLDIFPFPLHIFRFLASICFALLIKAKCKT